MTRVDDVAKLSRGERRRLLRFVSSFAWADLQVTPEEKAFVHRLVLTLCCSPEETLEVGGWLKTPPSPEDVDPTEIPKPHRRLFLEAAREIVESDGIVAPEEHENLRLLERLTL